MMPVSKDKVAVVGGGPAGLVALKELRTLGFDVTLFERREEVGGIWRWTSDSSMTTALKETQLCNSKFSLSLSDYQQPADFPLFLDSGHMGDYLRSYAKHFDLYPDIKFRMAVTKFSRRDDKWLLSFADEEEPREFDRVVWATGCFVNPRPISFEGEKKFGSRIIHSQEVRDLDDFKGQNVMVLGVGNTAGDVTINLVGKANNVYMSHRRGAKIFRRRKPDGQPADIDFTLTLGTIMWWIDAKFPKMYGKIMDGALDGNFKANWGENKPEWGFMQSPSIGDGQYVVVCNDKLIPYVKEGKVESLPGVKRIIGARSVEMTDGRVVDDLDAIICCTGYDDDMGMLSDGLSFVEPPKGQHPIPNLYMGMFPPEHADSLAIISNIHLNGPQISGRELSAMAVAQIWAGNSSLPPRAEMDAWVRQHNAWLFKRLEKSPGANRGDIIQYHWQPFVHNAAGTGMLDSIGWSRKAWALWWNDSELYRALAHGPPTAYAMRLFETGKRKHWPGARQAVIDAYNEVQELKKATKTQVEAAG